MSQTLASPVLSEIVERHRFFERWFNGEADERDLVTCLRRFDPLFRRVDPAGRDTDLAALRAALLERRGSRRTDPVCIAVEAPLLLWQGRDAALAAYVEAQSSAQAPVPLRRRSTALFLASTPDGPLLWRHVQETSISTFIPPGAQDTATTPGDGI